MIIPCTKFTPSLGWDVVFKDTALPSLTPRDVLLDTAVPDSAWPLFRVAHLLGLKEVGAIS